MADVVENKNLSGLNMEELLAEEKKRKNALLFHGFFIGLMAGVAVFSVVRNGFRLFPLALPLLLIAVFVRSGNAKKESLRSVRAEIQSRNEEAGK